MESLAESSDERLSEVEERLRGAATKKDLSFKADSRQTNVRSAHLSSVAGITRCELAEPGNVGVKEVTSAIEYKTA